MKQEMTRKINIEAGYTQIKEVNAIQRFREIVRFVLNNVDFTTIEPD